jgi:2-iminobutanoate/2-iminopropanoate deaminase
LADIGSFVGFNQAYAEFFGGIRPARTTVQSVLGGGIKVEIDAVARVRG